MEVVTAQLHELVGNLSGGISHIAKTSDNFDQYHGYSRHSSPVLVSTGARNIEACGRPEANFNRKNRI